MNKLNICVVLPTYNRLDKLKIALEHFEKQIVPPKYVIIVNNNSTDGTYEYLEKWEKKKTKFEKIIMNLDENTGGSKGFCTGLEKAIKLDVDWIWVSDDDAYPEANCFEIAQKFINENNKKMNISAVCGTVINKGKIDTMHRRRIKVGPLLVKQFTVKEKEYKKEYFKLDLFTYVGTLMNAKKLKKAGLTKTEYFIYYDDTEHSYRMSKQGDIICIPSMKINHDGPIGSGRNGVNWKYYYLIRNTLDFIKTHFDKRRYKFYCFYIRIKNYGITTLLYDNKKAGYKLINDAIKAGKEGRLGLDDTYKYDWRAKR